MESITLETRWVDIDSYGHMNNSKYFDLMTEARARCLIALTSDNRLQYILADTQCRFKIPIRYPSTITIEQSVTSIGNTSFELAYTFFTTVGNVHAEGKARMVCYDINANKPCDIPDSIKQYLQTHLKES